MDNILLAIAVGVCVWLFMRRARIARERQRQRSMAARSGGEQEAPKTMPRVGTPGTITRQQMAALKDNLFEPSRMWSKEEAALVLDSVSLLRAAIAEETGDHDPPIEVQNKVLGFILTDDELREFVLDWGRNRTREEEALDAPPLPRGEEYDRLVGFVRELWEES